MKPGEPSQVEVQEGGGFLRNSTEPGGSLFEPAMGQKPNRAPSEHPNPTTKID